MENWGMITYKKVYLNTGYFTNDNAAVKTISHELAHQWFGNLVTLNWWSNLWLNEGFATLFEYIGTDLV